MSDRPESAQQPPIDEIIQGLAEPWRSLVQKLRALLSDPAIVDESVDDPIGQECPGNGPMACRLYRSQLQLYMARALAAGLTGIDGTKEMAAWAVLDGRLVRANKGGMLISNERS
jgi:hypothetical protein